MSDPKPLASLGPQLLARKGGARPAMRPALGAFAVQSFDLDQDDLGWNDMGEPAPSGEVLTMPKVSAVPRVVEQRHELERKIRVERRPAAASGRRAAFTLRIEPERHLRLKLACTIKGRSAQSLVTEALDRLLSEIPDAVDLASQLAKARD